MQALERPRAEEMRSYEVGQGKAMEEKHTNENKNYWGEKIKCSFLKWFGRRARKDKQSGFRSILIGLIEAKIIGKC